MVIYARFSVEATVGYTSWWSLKMLRRTQHARARAGSWRHRTRVLTENRCHDVPKIQTEICNVNLPASAHPARKRYRRPIWGKSRKV